MKLLLAVFALLVLPASQAAQAPSSDRPVILAIGDSMTAGFGVTAQEAYPAQLERELARRGFNYRVVNQGVTGSTSTQTLSGLTRGLILSPAIVIVQTGGNDASAGIPRELSRANLRRIIALLKPGHARVLFAGGRFPFLDEAATAEGIPVIPFLADVQGHADLLIADGRHPNAEGYSLVVRNILKVLEPALLKKP